MLALAQLTWVHIAYASYMLRVQLVARVCSYVCRSIGAHLLTNTRSFEYACRASSLEATSAA